MKQFVKALPKEGESFKYLVAWSVTCKVEIRYFCRAEH
jgi:hypothetical protein